MQSLDLNLRHLRAAAATARLGSISAAAREVAVTQSAVTQALAKLERALGWTLFERCPTGMEPTPAALLFAPRIEAALAHIGSPRVTAAQMRALIAVADAGSYAAASVASGLAQPSLHRAVQDLGIALRKPLVARNGRGIALTELGRRTVRAFRLARAELDAGLSELESLGGREVGRIVVGAMPLSRAKLLPAASANFHRSAPDARIAIVEGSYAELIEPLRDGTIDLIIGALRDTAEPDLSRTPLFDDRPVIVARAGHPLARQGHQAGLAELGAFPWTVPTQGTPLRTQWERMFEQEGHSLPPVPIECGSVIVIRQILRDSDFLTLLSVDQVAAELASGWLTILREAPPSLKRTIGITTRAGWRPTQLQSQFLSIVESTATLLQN